MTDRDGESLDRKYASLLDLLKQTDSALLAFSGGVDSTFLLKAMKIAGLPLLAITGRSDTVPAKALAQAVAFAEEEQVRHRVILTGELQEESFVANPPDRCFFCKQDLFRRLRSIAEEESFSAVFDGSNADDLQDHRPGRRAAELYGVRSPLAEAGLSKDEIRQLSRRLGIRIWDSPASPCLSSRFPYGQRITVPLLQRVEQAEEYLRGLGLATVRVRIHDDLARIELPEEAMETAFRNRRAIAEKLRALGFSFVSLDLEGFRSGSMNRVLNRERPES